MDPGLAIAAASSAIQDVASVVKAIKGMDKQNLRLHLAHLEDQIYGGNTKSKDASWKEWLEILRAELAKAGQIPAIESDEWVVIPFEIVKDLTLVLLNTTGD